MHGKNFYELFGISADCPQNMIVPAFRARIKKVHPDKFQAQGETADNKQATIQLLQAYRVLSDIVLRKEYDMKLKNQQKYEEISYSRYFQEALLTYRDEKWFVQCEQCLGQTEIQLKDIETISKSRKDFFIKCWHCGLSLSLIHEQS